MRKKCAVLVLAGVMVASLAACGDSGKSGTESLAQSMVAETGTKEQQGEKVEENKATEKETEKPATGDTELENIEEEPIDGGWSSKDSIKITDEHKALFEKLNGQLAGATFEPVAFLGSQVVAGMNYRFLAKETATVPDAKPVYAIIEIYKDLDGNVSVNNIRASKVEAPTEQLAGGFTEPESYEIPAEVKTAMDEALAELTGVNYEPVAYLGSQVVAGSNYRIFCKSTLVTPDATSDYVIMTVYAGVDGTREILEIANFEAE